MNRRRARSRGRRRRSAEAVAPAELPGAFRERMVELLGGESEAFLAALAAPASGLRVNSLKIRPDHFREIAPFELEPIPHVPDGFLIPEEARAGAHPYHAAGLYYLQDPGAMIVGALAPLQPGARVLDLAAAPGGKSTHLASRMGGQGILVANDVVPSRARELAGNLERCGVRNAIVTSEAAGRLGEAWGDWFDLVLVDAPCSGESMFHKSTAARQEWSPQAVVGCARRQYDLMEEALELVRPGGWIVYSTCTFSPEENEGVLDHLLAHHPELEMAELPGTPGGERGRPEWVAPGAAPGLSRALRLWPHRLPGAGHFVAALRRRGASAEIPSGGPAGRAAAGSGFEEASRDARQALTDFLETALPGFDPGEDELVAVGDQLFLAPLERPPLEGVRALRSGLWLGTERKGRVDPSHALAMAVAPSVAAERVDLASTSAEVRAYLRGETLRLPGGDGWALVTVDGFPLGWGKRSGGVVKNHYPRGLRYL